MATTALSVTATPGRPHSFSAKSSAPAHNPGRITELSTIAVPGQRHAFSVKDASYPFCLYDDFGDLSAYTYNEVLAGSIADDTSHAVYGSGDFKLTFTGVGYVFLYSPTFDAIDVSDNYDAGEPVAKIAFFASSGNLLYLLKLTDENGGYAQTAYIALTPGSYQILEIAQSDFFTISSDFDPTKIVSWTLVGRCTSGLGTKYIYWDAMWFPCQVTPEVVPAAEPSPTGGWERRQRRRHDEPSDYRYLNPVTRNPREIADERRRMGIVLPASAPAIPQAEDSEAMLLRGLDEVLERQWRSEDLNRLNAAPATRPPLTKETRQEHAGAPIPILLLMDDLLH